MLEGWALRTGLCDERTDGAGRCSSTVGSCCSRTAGWGTLPLADVHDNTLLAKINERFEITIFWEHLVALFLYFIAEQLHELYSRCDLDLLKLGIVFHRIP